MAQALPYSSQGNPAKDYTMEERRTRSKRKGAVDDWCKACDGINQHSQLHNSQRRQSSHRHIMENLETTNQENGGADQTFRK